MESSKLEQTLILIKEKGVLRPRDLVPYGISRQTLKYLCERGDVERVGRGLYVSPDSSITQYHSLAEAAKRIPKGIICLLSALSFHELTTHNPSQVWMAINRKGWAPELDLPFIRLVTFSTSALEYGIETHEIEGVEVKIYTPAKTIADCFKYRNKIGLDIAIDALRDCLRQSKASIDQLIDAAEICRVSNVICPYLESIA